MFYLVLFTSLWIASKAVCTNECDLNTNTCSPGSNFVCMLDSTSGCNTCQDPCNSYAYNCDPANTAACSNYGNSYQCLPSAWGDYTCNSCQACACTAASGGCRSPQTCDLGAGGSSTECGVCVDPTPTTTTAVDPCPNACDSASNTCSTLGSNWVCLLDSTSGCNTCQDPCSSYPYNCDPANTAACSNYGSSYQCLPSAWDIYTCHSCQYCQCTAASGGCVSPQTCDLVGPGGASNQCGVCVDPNPTTTTAVDPCPNACDSASNTCSSVGSNLICLPDATSGCKSCQYCECTAGGCVSGEICGSVGNNGCGLCEPDPTSVTTTTSPCPNECDLNANTCSSSGTNFVCMADSITGCNTCQCACTALGGCTAPQTCDFTGSGGTANSCGVCIDPPAETTTTVTTVDPCPNACDRDPDPTLNACSSLGSNLVCLLDSTSGCTTCQDPCSSYPYNCDPANTAACSNYGSSYQCLPSAWGDYTCNSCQYCECTAASGTTGGCTTGVCTFDSSVGNNGCGVCVDACSGIATCESASECTAATTPGAVGSCVDVNDDGCKVCVFPDPAFTTTTTVDICPNGCEDDAGCVLSEYECGDIDANTGCGICLLKNRCSDTGECIFSAAYNGCGGGMICVESTFGSSTICGVCQCAECAEDVDCQFANSGVQGKCVKNTSTDMCGTCDVSQDITTTSGIMIIETGTTSAAVSGECGTGCKVGEGECESYEICKEDGVNSGCGICQEPGVQGRANQYAIRMVIGFVMMIFSWM